MSRVMHLRFEDQDASLSPTDACGALDALRGDTGLDVPEVVPGRLGPARRFAGAHGFVADDPDSRTLLRRDVTVRAVIKWEFLSQRAAPGQAGAIITRGRGGSPVEFVPFGLQLGAELGPRGEWLGRVRLWWHTADGLERFAPVGDAFAVPADGFVTITASREWLSAGRVLVRTWADDALLGEHESAEGVIGGGIGGHVVIGTRWDGAAYVAHFRGIIDELSVFDHAMTDEEVRTASRLLTVHERQAAVGLRDYHRVFDAKATDPESLDQLAIRVKAQGFAGLYSQVEDQHTHSLPDRAYGAGLQAWETCLGLGAASGASIAARRLRAASALRREHGYSRPALRASLAPLLDQAPEELELIEPEPVIREPFWRLDPLRWTVSGARAPAAHYDVVRLEADAGDDLRHDAFRREAVAVTTPIQGAEGAHVYASLRVHTVAEGAVAGVVVQGGAGDALWFGVARIGMSPCVALARYSSGLFLWSPLVTFSGDAVWLRLVTDGTGLYRLQYSLSGPESAAMLDAAADVPGPETPYKAGLGLVSANTVAGPVSVDVDEITLYTPSDTRPFHWYIHRDPTLPGAPDIAGAQAQLERQSPAHAFGAVITTRELVCDDPASQCDRTPLGGYDPDRAFLSPAERFEQVTGLAPDLLWIGHRRDVVEGLELIDDDARDLAAVPGLIPGNGITEAAFVFRDDSGERFVLPDPQLCDLDDQARLFVLVVRLPAGPPSALRSLLSKREPSPYRGFELVVQSSGFPFVRCDSGPDDSLSTLGHDIADAEWHTLAFLHDPESGTFTLASESAVGSKGTIPGDLLATVPLSIGAGRLTAAAAEVALVARCSGEQLVGLDPRVLAETIHIAIIQGIAP